MKMNELQLCEIAWFDHKTILSEKNTTKEYSHGAFPCGTAA